MRALGQHLAHQPVVAEQGFAQKRQPAPLADLQVVFGTRNRQLFGGDAPVEQLPRIAARLRRHPLAQVVGVKAGDQRLGPDAPPSAVEPERRFAGDEREPVALKMRLRMRHPGGVVPHPPSVCDLATQGLHALVQRAIGIGVGAVEQFARCSRARGSRGPVAAHLLQAAVDAAGGHHHLLGLKMLLGPAAFVDGEGTADAARLLREFGHAVPVPQLQPWCAAAAPGLLQGGDHGLRQVRGGAPQHVVTRQAVALAVLAALDPVDSRQKAQAQPEQPLIDLGRAALHVVFGPAPRPQLAGIELAKAQPVLQRALGAVGDALAPLQRGIDQAHAAKGPTRQAA